MRISRRHRLSTISHLFFLPLLRRTRHRYLMRRLHPLARRRMLHGLLHSHHLRGMQHRLKLHFPHRRYTLQSLPCTLLRQRLYKRVSLLLRPPRKLLCIQRMLCFGHGHWTHTTYTRYPGGNEDLLDWGEVGTVAELLGVEGGVGGAGHVVVGGWGRGLEGLVVVQ